jgi:hypothetical protein
MGICPYARHDVAGHRNILYRTVCGIVDGADWCQQFFDSHRPDAVRILDFSHAAGYLAQIAQAAFGPGTAAAAAWLRRWTARAER